jgi:hypothetical protein
MTSETYLLSFTSASLSHSKCLSLAQAFQDLKDWDRVEEQVLYENLLQARTKSSAKRAFRELVPRLEELDKDQMQVLLNGNYLEQKQMLWLAVCKRYRYIREFAVEVVREKFLSMDYQLTEYDYISFYNRKADWHPQLEDITESTQEKIRQVLFRMLKQAEIITEEERIVQVILSERVKSALKTDAPLSFYIFPAPLKGVNGLTS